MGAFFSEPSSLPRLLSQIALFSLALGLLVSLALGVIAAAVAHGVPSLGQNQQD
jgi:hypothetical protein